MNEVLTPRHTNTSRPPTSHDMAGIAAFPRPRFWGTLLLLLLALELRMHVHYAANFAWLFLWSRPVYRAQPGPLRWEIMYSPTSTSSLVEIGENLQASIRIGKPESPPSPPSTPCMPHARPRRDVSVWRRVSLRRPGRRVLPLARHSRHRLGA